MTHPDPTSSVAATPANPSPSQDDAKPKPTNATSSPGSLTPFAYFNPDTQSWKTSQVTFQQDSEPYKRSWPRSGMTVDGIAYQLPPSAHRTSVIEFSSSLHQGPNSHGLWPTATTQDHATRYAQGGMPLGMAARLFPTPTATANQDSPNERKKWPWVFPWPTPVTNKLAGGSGSYKKIKEMYERGEVTEEEFRSMTARNGGRLNPQWVEWLMGFPQGWTDLEDSETPLSPKSPNTSEGS